MKSPSLIAFLVGCSVIFAAASLGVHAQEKADWLNHAKWDEGMAEIGLYEGRQMKYGSLRRTSLEVVTVREHFNPDKLVKTDPSPGKTVLPVMKCNQVRRTRTGVYEYLQMGSAFVDRRDGSLQKISCVSAEWCGNSHATLLRKPGGAGFELTVANYFNDEGLSTTEVPAGAIFYDQLLMHLRQNLPALNAGDTFTVAKTLISNKPAYATEKATVKTANANTITLQFPERSETFVFDNDELRALRSWSSSLGERLKRKKLFFNDYWNRNKPGDERILR